MNFADTCTPQATAARYVPRNPRPLCRDFVPKAEPAEFWCATCGWNEPLHSSEEDREAIASELVRRDVLNRAVKLVASRQLAAPSALQRWMGISFPEADALLDEMHAMGYVGPRKGSEARKVHIKECAQCGRLGKRAFRILRGDGVDPIVMCENKVACRKRWPRQRSDESE